MRRPRHDSAHRRLSPPGSSWPSRPTVLPAGRLGAATALALDAKSKDNAAASEPGIARQTDSHSAAQQGNVATVVFAVGAAAVAAGVVLWLLSPAPRTQVGTDGHELLLRGTF